MESWLVVPRVWREGRPGRRGGITTSTRKLARVLGVSIILIAVLVSQVDTHRPHLANYTPKTCAVYCKSIIPQESSFSKSTHPFAFFQGIGRRFELLPITFFLPSQSPCRDWARRSSAMFGLHTLRIQLGPPQYTAVIGINNAAFQISPDWHRTFYLDQTLHTPQRGRYGPGR